MLVLNSLTQRNRKVILGLKLEIFPIIDGVAEKNAIHF